MTMNVRERIQQAIAERDAARGRPLTAKEKLDNLTFALGECDSDCLTHKGLACDCGALDFKARFGLGAYTP